MLEKEYGIPRRYLGTIMSPWAAKRLHEFGGDIAKLRGSEGLAVNSATNCYRQNGTRR
ncbi:hypothetical protein ACLB1O_07830 [Escherichia coli]